MTRLEKLEAFFDEVVNLTRNHNGIHFAATNDDEKAEVDYDIAVVYPSDLGKALEKVDPQWHSDFERRVTRLVEGRGMARKAAEIVVKKAMGIGKCCNHPKDAHFGCEVGNFCKMCPTENNVWEHGWKE